MTRTWLETRGDTASERRELELTLPFPGAVTATSSEPCACGSSSVIGDGSIRVPTERDLYTAKGFCAGCRMRRGTIFAKVDTLFGSEEDEAVLHGRWRVY